MSEDEMDYYDDGDSVGGDDCALGCLCGADGAAGAGV